MRLPGGNGAGFTIVLVPCVLGVHCAAGWMLVILVKYRRGERDAPSSAKSCTAL